MSAMQRRKGIGAELEVAGIIRDCTGWDVRRKVRQHAADSDLEGIPGWQPEVKRHKTASRAEIASWWLQTVAQATQALPVLFYRADRADWRAVWPLEVVLAAQWSAAGLWADIDWTADTTVEAWAAVARDLVTQEVPR